MVPKFPGSSRVVLFLSIPQPPGNIKLHLGYLLGCKDDEAELECRLGYMTVAVEISKGGMRPWTMGPTALAHVSIMDDMFMLQSRCIPPYAEVYF